MKKVLYEVITIFAPHLLEEKVQTHLKKIKGIISSNHGEILEEDHWDNKKLSYRINKFSSGIYHFMKVSAASSFVLEFRKYLSSNNEDIIRHSIIKVDNKPQKEKVAKKVVPSTGEEVVSSASSENGFSPASGEELASK